MLMMTTCLIATICQDCLIGLMGSTCHRIIINSLTTIQQNTKQNKKCTALLYTAHVYRRVHSTTHPYIQSSHTQPWMLISPSIVALFDRRSGGIYYKFKRPKAARPTTVNTSTTPQTMKAQSSRRHLQQGAGGCCVPASTAQSIMLVLHLGGAAWGLTLVYWLLQGTHRATTPFAPLSLRYNSSTNQHPT